VSFDHLKYAKQAVHQWQKDGESIYCEFFLLFLSVELAFFGSKLASTILFFFIFS